MREDSSTRFKVILFLLFIPAGFLTYLFHELGHWIVGEFLDNDMIYSLNGVWPASGQFIHPDHALYVNLGGPVFTIIQSIAVWIIIEQYQGVFAYPFVFFPVFSRFFTLFLGGFGKQDEAKIAAMLNIGNYTIAFMVLLLLLIVLLRSSSRLRIGLKYNCYFMAMSTACQLLIIQTDQWI